MIRRPPRSTLSSSSAASDVYKRQVFHPRSKLAGYSTEIKVALAHPAASNGVCSVSYTHLRAHETPEHLVCRLLLEKKKKKKHNNLINNKYKKKKKKKKKPLNKK